MHNTTMGAYDDEDIAYSPVDIVNNVVRMCLELHNEILSHSFVDLVCKLLVEEYVNLFVQLNIHVMVLGEDIFLQYRRSWVRVLCLVIFSPDSPIETLQLSIVVCRAETSRDNMTFDLPHPDIDA